MILKQDREKFLNDIKDIVIRKGIDFSPLEDLYQKARKKPKFLEEFINTLAQILDDREREYDLQVSEEEERDQPQENSSKVLSDGSITKEKPSKAFINPVSTYHWSRKKDFLNRFQDKADIKTDKQAVKIPEFAIRRKLGTSVWVYYLDENEEGEFEDLQMSLSTEPVKPEFDGLNYEDVISTDFYDPDDVFERKGRVSAPIDLTNYPDLKMDDNLCGVGVDVARYGADFTTIVVRQGIHTVDVQKYAKNDLMETTGYIVQAIHDWKPDYINVETVGGLGAGVLDRLLELGLDSVVNLCGVETQSTDVMYPHLKSFNIRTEMFLLLQERFSKGLITLPPSDVELAEEIVHIKYKINSDGKIQIVSNEDIKKRLKRSPDKAIALCLAFYNPDISNIY